MYRLFLLTLYMGATIAAPQNTFTPDPNTEASTAQHNFTDTVQNTEGTTELALSNKEYVTENSSAPIEDSQNQIDRLSHPHNYADRVFPSEIKRGDTHEVNEIKPDETHDVSEVKRDETHDATEINPVETNDVTAINSVENEELFNYVSTESNIDTINSEDESGAEITDIVASENMQSTRQAKHYSTDDITTEREDSVTEILETATKAPKSLAKLKYFEIPSHSSFSNNLVTGRRKFRSKCRCEKIWRCAKLQISVPRCPEEYFMCCS